MPQLLLHPDEVLIKKHINSLYEKSLIGIEGGGRCAANLGKSRDDRYNYLSSAWANTHNLHCRNMCNI
jgi:hypothetical protein